MNPSVENSVKVFLRVRPKVDEKDESLVDEASTNQMIVIDRVPYTFDNVFYAASNTSDVFNTMVEPTIEKLLIGYNCSILAYGQSGAGKTHTMGLIEQDNGGIIGRAIERIFRKLEADENCEVAVSFIEIYNEKVYDLLSDKYQESIYSKGSKFQGSTKIPISSTTEAALILKKGTQNRHVRATNLNNVSSRSHAMFSIFVTTRSAENATTSAVMHVCDLAGSEGLRYTQHKGVAQKESVNINRGLLALSKVVQALGAGKSLIPYRDSVLTVVMQESLNAHSYINILGCISPSRKDKNETMSTIRFAQGVKTLDNKNVPEFNAYLSEKQNISNQTFMRNYMMPVSRNDFTKTPGKQFQTPTASQRHSTIRKRPLVSRTFNSSAKLSKVSRRSDLPQSNDASYTSSIDNNVLNFSTSTEVDVAPSRNQSQFIMPSFSPLMRQIEKAIDTRLSSFMENQQFAKEKITAATIPEFKDMETNFTLDLLFPQQTSTIMRQTAEPRFNQATNLDTTYLTSNKPRNICLIKTTLETTSIPPVDAPIKNRISRRRTAVMEKENNELAFQGLRRSTRISINHEKRRLSVLAESKAQNTSKPSPAANPLKPISKAEHKRNILDLMNTGKFKELTALPTIGAKTAYQIITFRSVNGKFKTIDQMKSLEAMKGKKWQKFIDANILA